MPISKYKYTILHDFREAMADPDFVINLNEIITITITRMDELGWIRGEKWALDRINNVILIEYDNFDVDSINSNYFLAVFDTCFIFAEKATMEQHRGG
jgi:hypothetical protein